MNIANNIKRLRKEQNKTLEEVGKFVGVSKQTISRYESGTIKSIPYDKILLLSRAFNVSPTYLMGWSSNSINYSSIIGTPSTPNAVRIPVFGSVKAGIPEEAIEEILDWEDISTEMAKNGEHLALKIKGDSMTPMLRNNDVVIVRKQSTAESGQLVVALINGEDAVCKRLKKYENGLALISTNPLYEPMHFTEEEIYSTPITIVGIVVEGRQKYI